MLIKTINETKFCCFHLYTKINFCPNIQDVNRFCAATYFVVLKVWCLKFVEFGIFTGCFLHLRKVIIFLMNVLKISGSLIVFSHIHWKQIHILSFSLKKVFPNGVPIKKLFEVISYCIVLYWRIKIEIIHSIILLLSI